MRSGLWSSIIQVQSKPRPECRGGVIWCTQPASMSPLVSSMKFTPSQCAGLIIVNWVWFIPTGEPLDRTLTRVNDIIMNTHLSTNKSISPPVHTGNLQSGLNGLIAGCQPLTEIRVWTGVSQSPVTSLYPRTDLSLKLPQQMCCVASSWFPL